MVKGTRRSVAVRLVWVVVVAVSSVVHSGCGGEGLLARAEVALPQTAPFTRCAQWAVVTSHYAPLHTSADLSAPVVQITRRNDLLEVIARSNYRHDHYGHYAYWYQIETPLHSGWIFGGDVELYCYHYIAALSIVSSPRQ